MGGGPSPTLWGVEPAVARRLWRTLEPCHAVVYFAPEARQAYAAAGLKGGWMGYFASRAAPMGPVPAPVVTATFFNFSPAMVARAIPDAWRLSTPERVLAARFAVADAALGRSFGGPAEVREAADLARRAAEGCDPAGRPLFAGHSSLEWPGEPHLALWHAATLLREFRGDGHVAALVAEGLDGCEAHVTLAATGAVPRATLQPNRGWSDDDWAAAEARLAARGWLDAAGALTDAGWAGRRAVEDRTDRLALAPWERLGEAACARLHDLASSLSRLVVERGGVPLPNPMGAPAP